MAVSTRPLTRQRDYSRLLIALAVLAGVVAVAPIAGAIFGLGGAKVSTRTAFASAPAGEYAVLGRSEGQSDVISVAWASSPGATTAIVRVPHLEGFASTGAVSPDGRRLALVSVDGGSRTHPVASLNIVNLETGRITRAAANVAPAQVPVWTPDGSRLVVTRMPAGNESQGAIELLSVRADGKGEELLRAFASALGVYPVAYDPAGRLVSVVLDGSGSAVLRDAEEAARLSPGITRDWKLSPDGSQLAFIEVDTGAGVSYLARTVSLASSGSVSAESLGAVASALGVAWSPRDARPTFGVEPAAPAPGVSAQALTTVGTVVSGFDVPLGYSQSGDSLVVTHWDGSSFQQAGNPALELVTPAGRASYESFTRFYGWSAR